MNHATALRPAHYLRLAAAALCCGLSLTWGGITARAEDWAVGGFDVVQLLRGETVPGRPDIATRWHGKLWLFEVERNRNVFEADPRSYAPALDGLCPVALSEGRRSKGRPDLAVIINGRLYLPESQAARDQMVDHGEVIVAQARNVVTTARAKSRAATSARSRPMSDDSGEAARSDGVTEEHPHRGPDGTELP